MMLSGFQRSHRRQTVGVCRETAVWRRRLQSGAKPQSGDGGYNRVRPQTLLSDSNAVIDFGGVANRYVFASLQPFEEFDTNDVFLRLG